MVTRSVSTRLSWVGVVALSVALGAMAVDHLLGTDREPGESGLADPPTFAISAALCAVAAVALFGWVVPRALRRGPDRAASTALVLSIAAVVPGIAFWWLGFPVVVAGAGVALGLEARVGPRRGRAVAAAALGAIAIATVAVFYAVAAVA